MDSLSDRTRRPMSESRPGAVGKEPVERASLSAFLGLQGRHGGLPHGVSPNLRVRSAGRAPNLSDLT